VLTVSPAIARAVSRRGWRRPDRTPKTICAQISTQIRADRAFCDRWLRCVCVPAVAGASRGEACAELAQQVPVLPGVLYHLGPGRRFGAETPHRQPGAGRAGPRGQGPLPAAGGPVPGPDGGLGQGGGDCGHPLERSRRPDPVQGQKGQFQMQPGLAVIASHPGIVAPAAGVRQAPGLPPPGRCRPAGPGRQSSGPALAAAGRHGLPTGRRSEGQAHRSAGRRAGRSPGSSGFRPPG
jgi:hypothetical protein